MQRFGGFVAKYMGDGVLVYFGYPQAHEDDAERAVRAGLELVQAVGGLQSGVSLQTRVGIATGLVVVGDLIGSGAFQEQAVVCRCSARISVQHDLALRRRNNLRGAGRVIRGSQNKNLRTDWGAVVKIGNVIIGQTDAAG